MGRLIAIDGLDGSGKGTQAALLYERLCALGIPARLLSFPMYDSPSSAPVRMYLSGDFGSDPDAVNSYAASSFFAVDRFASFAADWKKDYEAGKVIIADRYTTANAIHQLTKLKPEKAEDFLAWLSDYEYGLLGIPAPDLTLFLEVPVEMSLSLIDVRGEKKDIHENEAHLRRAFDSAQLVSRLWGWEHILCTVPGGKMKSREEISEEIWARVRAAFPDLG